LTSAVGTYRFCKPGASGSRIPQPDVEVTRTPKKLRYVPTEAEICAFLRRRLENPPRQ